MQLKRRQEMKDCHILMKGVLSEKQEAASFMDSSVLL